MVLGCTDGSSGDLHLIAGALLKSLLLIQPAACTLTFDKCWLCKKLDFDCVTCQLRASRACKFAIHG